MQNIHLFRNIDPSNIEDLLRSLNARRISFKKDMTILSNLSNAREVGIMLEGTSSLIRIDYNGNRSIVSSLEVNDLFGGCFSDYMNEEMSVIATSSCEVLFVEYDRLIGKDGKRTKYHETIIENMIEIMMNKIDSYSRRIEILNKRSTRDKLLEYFHILEKEQGRSYIIIPFTYTLLADYLAVDRSAMMRELKNLKDDGLIETDGRKITLIYR